MSFLCLCCPRETYKHDAIDARDHPRAMCGTGYIPETQGDTAEEDEDEEPEWPPGQSKAYTRLRSRSRVKKHEWIEGKLTPGHSFCQNPSSTTARNNP